MVLRTALNTSPLELGYGFSVWSLPRLNAHLKKVTRISFSEDQIGRIVHQEKFSFQRPKHTLKGKRDEAAYEQHLSALANSTRWQDELSDVLNQYLKKPPDVLKLGPTARSLII